MTKNEVITLLENNKDERGIKHWEKGNFPKDLKSFGIGLTKLRKLAKKVGKDHILARELWNSKIYDALVIGILIDDPDKMTVAQAEQQMEEHNSWMLTHVYCACDPPIIKAPFVVDLAEKWARSTSDVKRRCGFSLLGELSKDRKKELPDEFFTKYIDHVEKNLQSEENFVRDAMNNFLFMVGQRNARLHDRALEAAKNIGPVYVDYGDNSCEAINVVKHLTSDRIRKKVSG